MNGRVFVISAPAGTGKSTLVKKLIDKMPDQIQQSCSMTTRPPRRGEIPGISYYFVDLDTFYHKIQEGAFLEYASVFGHYYGTLLTEVEGIIKKKHAILVLDTQGALQVISKIGAVLIFIKPPSLEELRKRLAIRGTEDEQQRLERLAKAQQELNCAAQYHYIVVNQELDQAVEELYNIIQKEANRGKYDTFNT